jgi:transcriptional regulator with XRE-family HTH domain
MSIKRVDKSNSNRSLSVNQQIRAARKSTGLTLNDLGHQIGISAQALSAIERGKANPSRQTLINLSRALESDFGEEWLRKHATGARRLTRGGAIIEAPDTQVSHLPEHHPTWDELILQWAQEAQEAANLPQPVKLFNQKSALMPIHYEILDGTTLVPYKGGDKIGVPYTLIPSIEAARCVRVQGSPIHDAFICSKDILVLYEVSVPAEGEAVLALVDSKVMLRRWELTGRKVTLTPFDQNYESLVVKRGEVDFIGQLMGVLRFMSVASDPLAKWK